MSHRQSSLRFCILAAVAAAWIALAGGSTASAATVYTAESQYTDASGALAGYETAPSGTFAWGYTSATLVPSPGDFAFGPDGETAYVVSRDGLLPLALGRGPLGPAIPVGASAQSRVAVSPDGTTVLVTDPASGRVTPVATATGSSGPAIPVAGARAVAIAPGGSTAYVTGTGPALTPVDLGTGTAGTPIALTSAGTAISITPDGKLALVAGGSASAGTVQIVDLGTGTAQPPIALGDRAAALLSLSVDGKIAAAADAGGALWRVDVAAGHATRLQSADGFPLTGLAFTAGGLIAVGYPGCTTPPHCAPGSVRAFDINGNLVRGVSAYYPGAVRPAPEPAAAFVPTYAQPDQAVTLDGSPSSNSGGTVMSYTWDFGDGSHSITSGSPTTTHTYRSAGLFTVRLTTVNAGGCVEKLVYTGQSALCTGSTTATTTRTISVQPPFQPPPGPSYPLPLAHTFGVSGLTAIRATLSGSVDWADVPRRAHFEYGPTIGYGSRTPEIRTPIANIASVRQDIAGLAPHHRYHYRLVVSDPDGTVLSKGTDVTFVTHTSGTLTPAHTVLRVAGRRVTLSLRCTGIRACGGRVAVVARVRVRAGRPLSSVPCGSVRVVLRAARTRSVHVPVGARCRVLLRRHGRLAGQVRAQLTTGQLARTRAVRLTGGG